jgi:hypothetical protein
VLGKKVVIIINHNSKDISRFRKEKVKQMTEKQRPNVVGKGPALAREMLEVFKEIQENSGKLSGAVKDRINSTLAEKSADLEKVIRMAYLKTVKAGEVAWDLKEKALELKEMVGKSDEKSAAALMDGMTPELDQFLHKIKTFVVRMT